MIFKVLKLILLLITIIFLYYIAIIFNIFLQLKNQKSDIPTSDLPIKEIIMKEKTLKNEPKSKKNLTKNKENNSNFKVLKREEQPERIYEESDNHIQEKSESYDSIENDDLHDRESLPTENDFDKEQAYDFSEGEPPQNNNKESCEELESDEEYERCMEQIVE